MVGPTSLGISRRHACAIGRNRVDKYNLAVVKQRQASSLVPCHGAAAAARRRHGAAAAAAAAGGGEGSSSKAPGNDARPEQQEDERGSTSSRSGSSKGSSSGRSSSGAIVAAVPTPHGTAWAGAYMSRARSVPAAVAEAVAAITAAAAAVPTPSSSTTASANTSQAAGGATSDSSSGSGTGSAGATAPSLGPPDLALVFAAAAYGDQLEDVVPVLRRAVPTLRNVFGCTSFGVIGSANGAPTDAEGVPALSVTLARLPGVDVRVTHTLRSGIPDEDAPPDAWAELVGLAPSPAGPSSNGRSSSSSSSTDGKQDGSDTDAATTTTGAARSPPQQQHPQQRESFLVLADPRFQQARALLAGLDFAFPAAAKVGGVVSSGQRHKRRAMFAWSADAPVDPGERRRRREQRRKPQPGSRQREQRRQGSRRLRRSARGRAGEDDPRQQQRQEEEEEEEEEEEDEQQQQQRGSGGFLGSLFGKLASRLSGGLSASGANRRNDGAGSDGSDGEDAGDGGRTGTGGGGDADGGGDSGLRPYGAAVLALRGGIALEPAATSQGYRPAGDRTWVVGRTSRDGAVIYSLLEADPASGAPAAGGSGGNDSDDDDDDGELPPLLAIVDALERAGLGRGEEGELTESEIEELSNDRVFVAIAPDALSADSDIGPDDFQMMKLTDFDESLGAVCVDGQVRTGYRLKLVVRDPEGTRADLDAKLVAAKRAELTAVVAGAPRAPPLAALVFADLERGAALHGEAGYEAGRVGAFVPTAPVCGMFAAAEVSTVNRRAGLYELATVAAVLRPVTPTKSAAVDGSGGGGAEVKV